MFIKCDICESVRHEHWKDCAGRPGLPVQPSSLEPRTGRSNPRLPPWPGTPLIRYIYINIYENNEKLIYIYY